MTLKINPVTRISFLDPDFVNLINNVLQDPSIDTAGGVILNFRDPTYSATNGGFHPVEICVGADGELQYLTDLAYFGIPPMAELEKELDWDFTCDRFSQFGRDHDIECGRALFQLYTRNFCAYHRSGVYEVSITTL